MPISINKRAYFDYQILRTYQAGIKLLGFEVKSVKGKRANLAGSYVLVRNSQAEIINMDIPPYQPKNTPSGYDSKRSRRLLLNKKEIRELTIASKSNLTIVPLKIYTKRGLIKIEIGLAKGKKKIDKREIIKEREVKKEMERKIKFGDARI